MQLRVLNVEILAYWYVDLASECLGQIFELISKVFLLKDLILYQGKPNVKCECKSRQM